ncbi:unnamed protein product, partial [Candidula unifasciata]
VCLSVYFPEILCVVYFSPTMCVACLLPRQCCVVCLLSQQCVLPVCFPDNVSSQIQKKKAKEEKKSLIIGPMIRKKSRDEPPFVVPQIFVDYGSRRTSYASASEPMMLGALALDLRRSSGSSAGSRRTSVASDSDRRGSNSSMGSRRTSYASDTDRRGSASSLASRRTSIFSELSDRRESASSRSSRKGSDGSRFGDSQCDSQDLSDPENYDMDDRRYSIIKYPPRRISYDVSRPYKEHTPPYRRSHSLAELQEEQEREKFAAHQEVRQSPGVRDRERRSTLSSLVFSSIAALDQAGNVVVPPCVQKKQKRQVIGLPDTPVALTDLNLEELMPRYVPPIKPSGKLRLQLLWSQDNNSLTVIIIEAQSLQIPGVPDDIEVNPYVKAFLVPGRTFKYRTKTLRNTRDPLFLEKFVIKDLPPLEQREGGALEFQVYSSHHVSRRHLVGVTSVRLIEAGKPISGQVELFISPQTVYRMHQGDLRVSGCYQPVAGKIVFNILEARNLPKVSLLGAVKIHTERQRARHTHTHTHTHTDYSHRL